VGNLNNFMQKLCRRSYKGFRHPVKFYRWIVRKLELKICQKFSSIDDLAFSASKKRLKQRMDGEETLNDVFRTTKQYKGFLVYKSLRTLQKFPEIEELLTEIESVDPQVGIEIGTFRGGTTYIFHRYLDCKKLISIDLPSSRMQKKENCLDLLILGGI